MKQWKYFNVNNFKHVNHFKNLHQLLLFIGNKRYIFILNIALIITRLIQYEKITFIKPGNIKNKVYEQGTFSA